MIQHWHLSPGLFQSWKLLLWVLRGPISEQLPYIDLYRQVLYRVIFYWCRVHSLAEKSPDFRFSSTRFYQIHCTHPPSTWSMEKVSKYNPRLETKHHASASVVVVNSLLATLNSRHALRRGGVHGIQSTEETTTSATTNTPLRTVLTRMYVVSHLAFFDVCWVFC